jgi:uncharacterized membrane protein YjjP (DUF1212 family)
MLPGSIVLRRGRNPPLFPLFVGAFTLSAVIFIIALRGGYDRLPLYISGSTMVLLAGFALLTAYNH